MSFSQQFQMELVKTGLALVVLLVTWFIGQRILASWDLRKKRQELDVAITKRFHDLYGEFKDIWRMWRIARFYPEVVDDAKALRQQLVMRACSAEGAIEAIIFKLAMERSLKEDDFAALGLFRQAYQQLRESIRNGDGARWTHQSPEYVIFNVLSSRVVEILGRPVLLADSRRGSDNIQSITNYRSDDWHKLVAGVSPQAAEGRIAPSAVWEALSGLDDPAKLCA